MERSLTSSSGNKKVCGATQPHRAIVEASSRRVAPGGKIFLFLFDVDNGGAEIETVLMKVGSIVTIISSRFSEADEQGFGRKIEL